jgi:hypothetical protein
MPLLRAFVIVIAMVAFSVCSADPPPGPPGREITVEGGGRSGGLTVEVAATAAERQKGLMDRRSMPENAGMLFLFPGATGVGFWMHNTYIPLSIAFLDGDGRVLEIRDGQPLDETVLTPAQLYRNVLEVNQGWFERHGLGVGSVVKIPADLAAR